MLSLVIIYFILVTCMFDQLVILKGEISCLSLLGLKGLKLVKELTFTMLFPLFASLKNECICFFSLAYKKNWSLWNAPVHAGSNKED